MLPVIYMLAIAAADLGGYLQAAVRFNDISPGTYETYRYAFFGPSDVVLSLAQGLAISLVVMQRRALLRLPRARRAGRGRRRHGEVDGRSTSCWSPGVNLVFVVLFLLKARIPIA